MKKEEYELIYTDEETGAYVLMHPNQNKTEREHNAWVGKFLAKLGYRVWLLAPSNTPNVKTADAWLENENLMVEFKHCQTPTASAVDKMVRDAKKQAPHILLHIDCEIDAEKVIEGVENRCQRPKIEEKLKAIWCIWLGELQIFKIEEIQNKSWRERLLKE